MTLVLSEADFMPLEVYANPYGDVVLVQEFPRIEGEHYARLIIRTDAIEGVVAALRAAADKAQRAQKLEPPK